MIHGKKICVIFIQSTSGLIIEKDNQKDTYISIKEGILDKGDVHEQVKKER